MKEKKSLRGKVLRILCFALMILLVSGLIEDAGDPYMPFITILVFYLIALGVPLLILMTVTSLYCRRRGERFWTADRPGLVRLIACSFPAAGALRLCAGALVTGLPKPVFFERSGKVLGIYLVLGLLLFAVSWLLKRRSRRLF